MTVLLWLAVPLAVVVVVSIVLWYREKRPASSHSSVEEFSKGLQALAPENPAPRRGGDRE